VRRYEHDVVLCVHNLARSAQRSNWTFATRALTGGDVRPLQVPADRHPPYLLTLAPRGSSGFLLTEPTDEEAAREQS